MIYLLLLINTISALSSWEGGANFTIKFDKEKNKLKFNVSVPAGTYFGIAFKPEMQDTDMVVFQGKDEGILLDLWSETYTTPSVDESNNYEIESTTLVDEIYNFIAYRDFDTGDEQQDFSIACGKDHLFQWVGNNQTAELMKHNVKDEFTLQIDKDCYVK